MTYDKAATLSKNTFTKPDYKFLGWSRSRNATTATYTDQQSVKNLRTSGSVILYAVWEDDSEKDITIYYLCSNTAVKKTQTCSTKSKECKLDANICQKSNYYYTMYNFDAVGSGIENGAQFSTSDDLVSIGFINEMINNQSFWDNGAKIYLTPEYKNLYTVPLKFSKSCMKLSGTMPTQASVTCTNVSCVLPDADISCEGYRTPWNKTWLLNNAISFNDVSFPVGEDLAQMVEIYHEELTNAPVDVIPNWEPISYTISYNKNKPQNVTTSVEGSMANTDHVYNLPKSLRANTYSLRGYQMTGWNTQPDGSGTEYEDGQYVSNLTSTDSENIVLYAQWTADTYQVTPIFNANGGTGKEPSMAACTSNSCALPANTYTRTGYTFMGWEVTDDCNVFGGYVGTQGDNIGSGINTCIGEVGYIYLSAMWAPNKYTVTFDANGGEGTMADQSREYDDGKALTANAFTKAGYTFAGWATSPNATEVIYPNQTRADLTTKNGEKIVLYAVWVVKVYTMTLSFAAGDATGGTTPASISCSSTQCVLPNNTFIRDGYTFLGWELCDDPVNMFSCGVYPAGENLAGGIIEAHDKQRFSAVALWQPNKYRVSFNPNGGDGSMDSITMTYDVTTTLPKNTFTKSDYKFLGWSKEKNSTSVEYSDQQSVKNLAENNTVVLYAVWGINTDKDIRINYICNGTAITKTQICSASAGTCVLDKNACAKSGYYYNLYDFAAPGTDIGEGIQFFAGDDLINNGFIEELERIPNFWTSGAKINLTPEYKNLYTVPLKFSKSCMKLSGTMPTQASVTCTNVSCVLPDADISCEGYRTPWNKTWLLNNAISFNDVSFPVGEDLAQMVEIYHEELTNAPVDVIPNWEPISYTISYNKNKPQKATAAVEGSMDDTNHTYNSPKSLRSNAYSLRGYTTTGWNTEPDGSGTSYTDEQNVTNLTKTDSENVVLYAQWVANSHTISFDANGGEGTMATQTFVSDTPLSLNANTFTRTGYTFTGWSTAANGIGGTAYTDGQSIPELSENITLYAQWKLNTYTCKTGEYLDVTTCAVCPAGSYCPNTNFTYNGKVQGMNECSGIAQYQDLTGQTSCKSVGTGYYKKSNLEQAVCGKNSYCVNGVKVSCPDGGRTDTDTASSIEMCYSSDTTCQIAGGKGSKTCYYDIIKEEYVDCTPCAVIMCEAGYYMNNDNCTICPEGSYCANNDITKCEAGYTSEAGSSQKTHCFVPCESFEVTYGVALPDEEAAFWPNICKNNYGISVTGNECKIVNNVCVETTCRYDYEMKNGKCVACTRDVNALSYKKTGNCEVEACAYGYHPYGQQCVEDVISCTPPKGALEAQQTWNPKTNSFDVCTVTECEEGYHIANNACVADTMSCELRNGIGVKTWNHTLKQWDECIATKCNPGYTNDPTLTNETWEQCGKCSNMYGTDGDKAASSYTTGCEIASCMYQGEKYILENNECRLICDEMSDYTGSRYWSGQKCVQTCNPGYVKW